MITITNTPLVATAFYDAGTFGAVDTIVIFVQPWPTQTGNIASNNFRFTRAQFNPPATSQVFHTEYVANFGPPVIGSQAFVRIYTQSVERYRSIPTETIVLIAS